MPLLDLVDYDCFRYQAQQKNAKEGDREPLMLLADAVANPPSAWKEDSGHGKGYSLSRQVGAQTDG